MIAKLNASSVMLPSESSVPPEMTTPSLLAGAISEALVTTAAGLVVAIPTLICASYLNSRVEKNIAEMEKFVTGMMLRLTGRIL